MSAGCTTACSSRPSVSTRIWRFLPLSSCQHHSRSDRCGAPFFRALHALAVDDAGRRARFTIHGFATLHVERVMNAIQRAVPVPKEDTQIVLNFIQSRAIVEQLDHKLDLRGIFSRPGVDRFSAFNPEKPIEKLVRYWKTMVETSVQMPS